MKTDAQMKNKIIEELLWDTTIKLRDIVVRAHQGVVTLSGTVSNFAEKSAPEMAVQRVSGVIAIAEELEVYIIDGQLRADAQVAGAVARTLHWHSAVHAIKSLAGVQGVSNKVEVKPFLMPSEVKHSIEAALKRNAQLDAQSIAVTTDGGQVTLYGNVRSWDERREVATTAWHTRGVTNVENLLTVN